MVCLYPKNVKTAEPIRLKFCVGPQGRSIDDQKFKKLSPNKIEDGREAHLKPSIEYEYISKRK